MGKSSTGRKQTIKSACLDEVDQPNHETGSLGMHEISISRLNSERSSVKWRIDDGDFIPNIQVDQYRVGIDLCSRSREVACKSKS